MSPAEKTEMNIYTRLAQVRNEIGALAKTETANVPTKGGGKYSYSYLSLDALLETVRPAMDRAGIYDMQRFEAGASGELWLRTDLTDGDTIISSVYPIPPKAGDDQVRGSAISYGRRYSLLTMLGLPTTDDDGAATHRPAVTTQAAVTPQVASAPPEYEVPDDKWQQLIDDMATLDDTQKGLIAEWWSEHGDGRSKPARDVSKAAFIALMERVALETVKVAFDAAVVEDEPF